MTLFLTWRQIILALCHVVQLPSAGQDRVISPGRKTPVSDTKMSIVGETPIKSSQAKRVLLGKIDYRQLWQDSRQFVNLQNGVNRIVRIEGIGCRV